MSSQQLASAPVCRRFAGTAARSVRATAPLSVRGRQRSFPVKHRFSLLRCPRGTGAAPAPQTRPAPPAPRLSPPLAALERGRRREEGTGRGCRCRSRPRSAHRPAPAGGSSRRGGGGRRGGCSQPGPAAADPAGGSGRAEPGPCQPSRWGDAATAAPQRRCRRRLPGGRGGEAAGHRASLGRPRSGPGLGAGGAAGSGERRRLSCCRCGEGELRYCRWRFWRRGWGPGEMPFLTEGDRRRE